MTSTTTTTTTTRTAAALAAAAAVMLLSPAAEATATAEPCVCPEVFMPVCDAASGTTFSNDCFAACAGVVDTVEGECSELLTPAPEPEAERVELLFQHVAAGATYVPGQGPRDGVLTLLGVDGGVVAFGDRPSRVAYEVHTSEFIDEFYAADSSFDEDPPNAAFSCAAAGGVARAVFELYSPSLAADALAYEVKLLYASFNDTGGVECSGFAVRPSAHAARRSCVGPSLACGCRRQCRFVSSSSPFFSLVVSLRQALVTDPVVGAGGQNS